MVSFSGTLVVDLQVAGGTEVLLTLGATQDGGRGVALLANFGPRRGARLAFVVHLLVYMTLRLLKVVEYIAIFSNKVSYIVAQRTIFSSYA